ncbi:MAG: DUF3857 domain-containing protein [Gammaproteobacteria bacterium]|nr:DUF3857 domain-containing protein [Gammaproteobacteria bacterium]
MKPTIYSFFLWVIILTPANAKWATIADAPTKHSYNKEINVNSDGTIESIEETNKEILTEIGRNQDANTVLYYNGDSEKIDLLEAKTIYKGKEHPLDKDIIEDKPLASSHNGFDQTRQILLAFPKTEIGAKIYAKYKYSLKKPALNNYYADTFYFGEWNLVSGARIKITSKIPLHILVNDPKNYLKITERKTKDSYRLEIILKRPIYKAVIDESWPIIINKKHIPWVSVSSINKWDTLAVKQGELVAKVFTQKLPQDFEEILEKARQKTNEIDQINIVTSLLNDKIRYMGDWKSVSGRYIPRDLDKISKTQLGDCKDFSAATAAILTKLGFKAQIVVIRRGITNPSLLILPGLDAFNHAMVKVTNKQGKIYWIDPTNFASMAGGIFPDIANKMALILDPKHPGYEKTPESSPLKASSDLKRTLEISNNKITEIGDLVLKEANTLGLIGASLKVSDETIKNAIFYALADYTSLDEKDKKTMNIPKLNSRIVKEIALNYSFIRENDILQTNVGPALKLKYAGSIPKIYDISQDNVADTVIHNYPNTEIRQTIIKNARIKNSAFLNKEKKTPWLYVKRACSLNKNHDLQIDEKIILYKNIIPGEDFKKPGFIELKKWLNSNFKDVIIVFEPMSNKN